jgi:multidrug efflux pump
MLAAGAGAEMRRSLGTAVFSGMLGVTLFGIFLTPVFFYVIQGLGESRLMTADRTRWILSITAGGALGLTIGFLLSQLGLFRVKPACFVGAAAGILAALAMLEIHRRFRATPAVAALPTQNE